jgi:hypothetical protein
MASGSERDEVLARGANVAVEMFLGDIQADEKMVHDPCLSMRASRATVRVHGPYGGRGPTLSNGLARPGRHGLPPTTLFRSILSMDLV